MKAETITTIILAFIGSQAFTTIVSKYKPKTDITAQNIQQAMEMSERLESQYDKLVTKYDDLQGKYDKLKKEFDRLESENMKLKTKIETKKGGE